MISLISVICELFRIHNIFFERTMSALTDSEYDGKNLRETFRLRALAVNSLTITRH